MENPNRNRNLWIAVIAAVVVVCCCIVALAALAFSVLNSDWFNWNDVTGSEQAVIERSFETGAEPSLTVDNFAGSVTVRSGEAGRIRVVATKRTRVAGNLERIDVQITQRGDGVEIQARNPGRLSNSSVRLEITAPPGARLDLSTGAGSIDASGFRGRVAVSTSAGSIDLQDLGQGAVATTSAGSVTLVDVKGPIDARSNAGTVTARGAEGSVRLFTSSGSIVYEGAPTGDCSFESNAGGIQLHLPRELNMAVDLRASAGNVTVNYDVDGQTSTRRVTGVIGTGAAGQIEARAGAGSITLSPR